MTLRFRAANWRLILIVLVGLALAPVTWLRSEIPEPNLDSPVLFTRLMMPQQNLTGEVHLLRGWKLTSVSDHFGGYSALLALNDQHLFAASYRGRTMELALNGDRLPTAQMAYLSGEAQPEKHLIDVESLTRDPATGRIWIGYEGVNAIERREADLTRPIRVQPEQMQRWSTNQGAEAMTRLHDGRFVVIAEKGKGWEKTLHAGLLYASDPVAGSAAGGAAEEFRFRTPSGYRPVDMVQIPDGRVLILARALHLQLMPRFTAKLILADPAKIIPGEIWSGRVIADFDRPIPSDKFEGLAMWPRADGLLDLWLISDDNRAGFQNTYLIEMRWDPRTSATAEPDRNGEGKALPKEKGT